mmetsp:Transcript_34846/g.64987  ORF Transcript_34846/g.64987 Transcript_34846/m.64987 type:complete len:753 (-) Transcript_34846:599-2857(-)
MSRAPKMCLALETDVVQDNMPCEVYPNIYIGSIHAAFNQEALIDLGITHILNASRLPSTFPKTFTYLSIDIRDKEESNILSSIPAANIFIEAGVASGGVLVHCYGGRSRSAAFVCAFLMSSHGWPYEQAQGMIYSARPVACINSGFEAQLRAYIYSNYDVYVAQQVLLLGRVQALQKYRAIRGTTENELEIKASQRKKFGIKNVLSGGGGGRGEGKKKSSSSSGSGSHSGMKRSWRSAKEVEEKSGQEDDENMCVEEGQDGHEHEEHELQEEEDSEEQLSRAAAEMGSRQRSNSISSDVVVGHQPSPTNGPGPSTLRKHIPLLDPRSPRCRLSRPGSTSVRIIPPLRGLERVFCCSWCQFNLFNLASVIRTDLDLRPLREMLSHSADDKASGSGCSGSAKATGSRRNPFGGGGGGSSKDDQSFSEHFPEDRSADSKSMPAPSQTMSRSSSSGMNTSMSPPIAPPKPVYREPPKTMRNRGAKSFDFDGFGGGGSPAKSTPLPTQNEEGSSKMDVENSDGGESSSGVAVGSVEVGSVEVPKLSIGRNSSGPVPSRLSARGLQIQAPGSSNMNSPLESPRIPLPPHRVERSSYTYPSPRDRPQSAEKTRWLARVNLLGQGDPTGQGQSQGDMQTQGQGHKGELIDKMSQDDDEAIKLGFGREKYIHVEYLEWMGDDLLSHDIDEGELKCGHCQRIIGTWNWNPHPKHTLYGQLEPPLIRVHKNVVQEVDVPLDSTPANTPRLPEEFPLTPTEEVH